MTLQFVSGIDTDAGKTIATGWLAGRFLREGRNVVTAKLVQTGSDELSPDILTHRRLIAPSRGRTRRTGGGFCKDRGRARFA